MSLNEIREIREKCDVDLEMFMDGAMCISYSGRCLLSNYFTGRDSNRGSCAQSCRWKYALVEETRPGKYFPIEEDDRGTYIMNSKDMCLMPHIKDVIESGVDSLKIEGRMKSVHYAASVTKAYRLAIDSYFADPENFTVKKEWMAPILHLYVEITVILCSYPHVKACGIIFRHENVNGLLELVIEINDFMVAV
jgi:putative protease